MNQRLCVWIADRIPTYLDGRQADVQALRHALGEDDFPSIQKMAHNMKGTGSAYGFCAITEIGGNMEAAAKAGDRAEIEACLAALSDYLASIKITRLDADDAAGTRLERGGENASLG